MKVNMAIIEVLDLHLFKIRYMKVQILILKQVMLSILFCFFLNPEGLDIDETLDLISNTSAD